LLPEQDPIIAPSPEDEEGKWVRMILAILANRPRGVKRHWLCFDRKRSSLRQPPAMGYNAIGSLCSGASAVHIIKYPHPTLRHKSKPLRRIDAGLRRMVAEMFELMYANKGIGLAANQVDLPYRLIVVNPSGDPAVKDEEHVFINPEILRSKGSAEDREGCLSLPEIYAPVKRPEKIVLSAYDLSGREVTWELDGLYGRVVQHECDHLDGVLFIDRLTPSNLLTIKQALADLEVEFSGNRQRGLIPDDLRIAARLTELETART
jgi:peptide deformylase